MTQSLGSDIYYSLIFRCLQFHVKYQIRGALHNCTFSWIILLAIDFACS